MTDADLKGLARLKNLAKLDLADNNKITSAGLKELTALEKLSDLRLGIEQATAAGLNELSRLKSLRSLSVEITQPTEVPIKELVRLKNLEELDVRGAKFALRTSMSLHASRT